MTVTQALLQLFASGHHGQGPGTGRPVTASATPEREESQLRFNRSVKPSVQDSSVELDDWAVEWREFCIMLKFKFSSDENRGAALILRVPICKSRQVLKSKFDVTCESCKERLTKAKLDEMIRAFIFWTHHPLVPSRH